MHVNVSIIALKLEVGRWSDVYADEQSGISMLSATAPLYGESIFLGVSSRFRACDMQFDSTLQMAFVDVTLEQISFGLQRLITGYDGVVYITSQESNKDVLVAATSGNLTILAADEHGEPQAIRISPVNSTSALVASGYVSLAGHLNAGDLTTALPRNSSVLATGDPYGEDMLTLEAFQDTTGDIEWNIYSVFAHEQTYDWILEAMYLTAAGNAIVLIVLALLVWDVPRTSTEHSVMKVQLGLAGIVVIDAFLWVAW